MGDVVPTLTESGSALAHVFFFIFWGEKPKHPITECQGWGGNQGDYLVDPSAK